MKILISGADGDLGKALSAYASKTDEVTSLGKDKLDVTKLESCVSAALNYKPDAIINCAAETDVDWCEEAENAETAFAVNSIGARNIAVAAEKAGAKLVYVSTDFVFDGNTFNPYTEASEPNPVNFYGKTKLLGERYSQMFCKKTFVARTSWLFGGKRCFVSKMLSQADKKAQISVAADSFGSPTSVFELSKQILSLLKTEKYGVYNCVNSGICSRFDLVKEAFGLSEKDCIPVPVLSSVFSQKAKRPQMSALDPLALKSEGMYIMKDWKSALYDWICGERGVGCD